MNILIVDENEVVRRQLFWALRGGNDLQEAASREEAEAILTSMVPDVVLMELLQEGDSDESAGTALVERVLRRAEPPLIIIITRSNRKDVAGALLQAGVFDYLEKPVNLTDLPSLKYWTETEIPQATPTRLHFRLATIRGEVLSAVRCRWRLIPVSLTLPERDYTSTKRVNFILYRLPHLA